jgi:hypothetical protein
VKNNANFLCAVTDLIRHTFGLNDEQTAIRSPVE